MAIHKGTIKKFEIGQIVKLWQDIEVECPVKLMTDLKYIEGFTIHLFSGMEFQIVQLDNEHNTLYAGSVKEKGILITAPIYSDYKIFEISEGQLEELRKEIITKFEGKDVSLNQLLSEYGSNELVDVSVGEPDSPFDYGRWKGQLEAFKKVGASDIVLMEVSEGGYGDVISLQTSTIRLMVTEPTTELMKAIENLKPDSIDYQKGYIELFFD